MTDGPIPEQSAAVRAADPPPGPLADPPSDPRPAVRGDPALLIGRQGRWRWPWALLGPVFAIVVIFGIHPTIAGLDRWAARQYAEPVNPMFLFAPGRLDLYLAFLTFSFVLVAAAFATLHFVHGQSWRAGLGPLQRFDWPLFWRAALALFLVNVLAAAFDGLRNTGSMQFIEHGWRHVPWLLLAMLVILPQTFAEDYVFKGYLLRVWGAVVPIRRIAVAAVATAFTMLHAGNTDVGSDLNFNITAFLLMELLAFALVLRTGTVATATGLHWMNNVFVMCLITTLPGQPSNFALIEFAHPLVMAGGSKSSDPVEWISLLVSLGVLWAMLSWPRSPLYLPSADYSDGQLTAERTEAEPSAAASR